jgi:hypothetical protein
MKVTSTNMPMAFDPAHALKDRNWTMMRNGFRLTAAFGLALASALASTPVWSQNYGDAGLTKVIRALSTMTDADLDVRSGTGATFLSSAFDGEINECTKGPRQVCHWQRDPEQGTDLIVGIAGGRIEAVMLYDVKRALGPNWLCRVEPGAQAKYCTRSNVAPAVRDRLVKIWRAQVKASGFN